MTDNAGNYRRLSYRRIMDFLNQTPDRAPFLIFWVDNDGRLQRANKPAMDTLGFSPDDIRADAVFHIDRMIGEKDWPGLRADLKKSKLSDYQTELIGANEKKIPVSMLVIHMETGGEEYFCFIGHVKSIGESSEDASRPIWFAMNRCSDAAYWVGPDAKFIYVNQAASDTLGYTRDELLNMSVHDIDPDFQQDVWPGHWKEIREKGSFVFESRHRAKDGTIIPVEISVNYLKFGDKEYNCVFAHDIRDRKKSEITLKKSEATLGSIFRAAPTGIGLVCDRIIKKANKRLCEMLGYTPDELIDQNARMIYPTQEDYDWVGDVKYKQIRERGTGTVETRWKCKDGKIIDVILSSTPLNPNNLSEGVTFTALDITDRKRALNGLEESERRFRGLYENMRDGIVSVELTGEILNYNPAYQRMLGYPDDELKKLAYQDITPEKWHEMEARIIAEQVMARGYSDLYEKEYITRDGTIIPIELRAYLNYDNDGKPSNMWAFVRDITKRKRAENALRDAMAEVQELKDRLQDENIYLREEIKDHIKYDRIIGRSEVLDNILEKVSQVAVTDASVLIYGETGTGKELIARAIHERGLRKDHPMIKVNCASIPKDLFESEFFGHIKGAFTGAYKDRIGRFQLADGGTLFLDEIGEIPLELQSKLLRVLQEGELERVGEEITHTVDVRIIASTNRHLEEEIMKGKFRQDLYFRLSVFPIEVAPLRKRKEDIPLLAEHFLEIACRRIGIPKPALTNSHIGQLQGHDWPGNVRELQNIIERSVIASRGGIFRIIIPSDDVRQASRQAPSKTKLTFKSGDILTQNDLREIEIDNITAALKMARGRIYGPNGAAAMLGIKPTTLASRIKALGIKTEK